MKTSYLIPCTNDGTILVESSDMTVIIDLNLGYAIYQTLCPVCGELITLTIGDKISG